MRRVCIGALVVCFGGAAFGQVGPLTNGAFSNGMSGWTTWIQRDSAGDFWALAGGEELKISGTNFNGGVYQQFDTGGAGMVVNVIGRWRSDPAVPNAMWAEVLAINGGRVPADGVDETDGANGAVLLYKNDTYSGRGAWDGPMPMNSPLAYRVSFVAAGPKATLLLKTGNSGPGSITGAAFDDIEVHCVPQAATMAGLPAGFAGRTYVFPVSNMVCIAQSPASRNLYAVSNEGTASNTRLYRVDVGGPSIATTPISGLGSLVDNAQGMTFDRDGNLYISTFYGKVIKGVDTNPDPAVDAFSFSQILDLPDQNIGTFHGVGGVAVGPDNLLYINSGSQTHYGPEPDNGFNARILRCGLGGGLGTVAVFAEGVRNSFDIAFRSDGKLFGVENGPLNGCDYGEEFNLLEEGQHYGFPYKFGSDLNGSDSSISCSTDPGKTGPQPLPAGLNPRGAWANYGPDAKPGPGQPGHIDGGVFWTFNPHSSPDGLSFYEPAQMDPATIKFPAEFHGRAFVARFGNLENVPSVGYDVLTLRLDEPNAALLTNTFLSGLGRSIDVLCAYSGRVYVLEYNQQTSFNGAGWGTPSRLYEIRYTVATQPQISPAPAAISRTVDFAQIPSDDTLTITNTGTGTLNYTVSADQDWVAVSPSSGSSTGPSDPGTVTVSYGTEGFAVGAYTAHITISDPAAGNSPMVVPITIVMHTVGPDFDTDGDVDQGDFGHMQACFSSAPGLAPPAGCLDADLDHDGDVDGSDLSTFRGCMAGAGVIATPGCAG